MALAVIFPKLDEAMTSGKIVRWLKNEGDSVEKGEIILEIESEKTSFELDAETSGILSKIMYQAGDEVVVGTVIAYILQPGEEAPEVETPAAIKAEEPAAEVKVETSKLVAESRYVKASPLARNIAKEHGVDISLLSGTGPGGRITKEDVLEYIEEGKPAMAPATPEEVAGGGEETVPLSTMREVIARRMVESFQTPHFYLTVEVDAQELQKTRQQLLPIIESRTGVRLTLTDLLIQVAAKALEKNPAINCSYADGSMKQLKRIDIGLVTSVEDGLMVPIIREANIKSLAEIAQTRAELVQKARERTLSKEDMTGSTFTISNMGMYDIDQFSAIIQPPEAAILAVGGIAEKVVARKGEMIIRPVMSLTLSIDHRVLDGALGAQFLQTIKGYIENPVSMVS